jgi:8-oxo-dGTP pyrophosphatase MutT (NUDIX family)
VTEDAGVADRPARRPGGNQRIPRPSVLQPEPFGGWPEREAPSAAEIAEIVTAAELHVLPMLPAFPDARSAAVLVALVDGPMGAEVLLTKRAAGLRNHSGEISFPGGRIDEGETPPEAALREAFEEVGLPPDVVTIAGQLSHLSTVVSRSYIVPVVGTLGERPALAAFEAEVEKILWVPVAELVQADTFRAEWWGTPPLGRRMKFFDLDDETIWRATAHVLDELLALVYGPPNVRTAE